MGNYGFSMLRGAITRPPEGLRDAPHLPDLHDRLAADGDVRKGLAKEGIS